MNDKYVSVKKYLSSTEAYRNYCPVFIFSKDSSKNAETIIYATDKATKQAKLKFNAPVLCAGGVMSNKSLQKHMSEKFGAFFASPELSGDNAVGVAILAAKQNGENLW